jgi:hypothetical protein
MLPPRPIKKNKHKKAKKIEDLWKQLEDYYLKAGGFNSLLFQMKPQEVRERTNFKDLVQNFKIRPRWLWRYFNDPLFKDFTWEIFCSSYSYRGSLFEYVPPKLRSHSRIGDMLEDQLISQDLNIGIA